MKTPHLLLTFLVTIATVVLVNAQTGPYPQRLNIPGALPVPARNQYRSEKLAAAAVPVRARRPAALRAQQSLPAVTQRIVEEAKPVTESEEDEQPDVYLPQLLREQQLAQAQQQQFQQTANAFLSDDPNGIQDLPLQQRDDPLPSTRFPERLQPQPQPTSPPSSRPAFEDYGIGANIGNAQRFAIERTQPNPAPAPQQRVKVIRTRPAPPRPQYEPQIVQAPVRPRPKPIQPRPIIDQNQLADEREVHQPRRQRPVVQNIRKWREENEDGSITWGYENDDGSFKEELIGTDCITKGTYGYVDPDGNKREYHYETGIKCDPNNREAEEELENGFINYEDNKAVLPNGIEIDMNQLGKRKSKRPNAIYRN
ncbi:translation initiation factor IF-2 [Teleopsis dalmanni]|uniref:translation initiation factor IF-2 n=1 Tax=Teleopsis dalmanni TaxID=139649 RepID=UPI0018CEE654|nr:translation initiation factor IF-2 [Teleopsis dalmanni]